MQRHKHFLNGLLTVSGTTAAIGVALVLMTGCPTPGTADDNANTSANDNGDEPDNANAPSDNENATVDNENDNAPADNENDNGAPEERAFVGAETCMACHADTHTGWVASRHASALEALRNIGQEANADCIGCHTVGFGETDGFVDEATTPGLVGVQCENCHGPAGAHSRDPGNESLRPTVSVSADVCGACHNDAHHPTIEEWSLSKHSMAVETIKSHAFGQDVCLACHSQDYRYALELREEDPDVEIPTIETAVYSIECVTCHTPHGGLEYEHQLRAPIANVCGECHTQGEEVLPDNTPHHPQLEMIIGLGAFQSDGTEATASHTHGTLVTADGGEACAQCHVVQHEVEEPNDGDPNVTGHTFNPFDNTITAHQAAEYTGCSGCHTAEAADEKRAALQQEITLILLGLAFFFDDAGVGYIDPATLTEAERALLTVAKFNYQFVSADGSNGVHNPTYARELLDIAKTILANLVDGG